MEKLFRFVKKILPAPVFRTLQPIYHYKMALFAALIYRFPSRKVKVVGVTGTKGKSTVTELTARILREAGYTVALSNTLRFKVGEKSERNLHKMTMPGRFFIQQFLRRAVRVGCDWVVLEMTSEGVRQFRHKLIALDALIFTNLSPEHIESHGSFENYRDAKRALGRLLEKSPKKDKTIIANADDPEGGWYLSLSVAKSVPYSRHTAEPYEVEEGRYTFTFSDTLIRLPLPGLFNLYNALAAAAFARSIGITADVIKRGIESTTTIRGRVEYVQKEPFAVVVDYAHTIDSLSQFYSIFQPKADQLRAGKSPVNICVLGNTGGGRDTWKRPKMAGVAEEHCDRIILTNEDPYDEDPEKILHEMAEGIQNKEKLEIILDRRQAIDKALKIGYDMSRQGSHDVNVLITGKGTDPYIMGAGGTKTPWDDATVVRELLE